MYISSPECIASSFLSATCSAVADRIKLEGDPESVNIYFNRLRSVVAIGFFIIITVWYTAPNSHKIIIRPLRINTFICGFRW